MHDELLVGIDLGSSTIRVAVGKREGAHADVQILAAIEEPSEGISKGAVTNIESAVSSVSRALEKAERIAGLPFERTWIAVTEPHMTSELVRGVVGVSRPEAEITEEDVERVIDAAHTHHVAGNAQVLHVLPQTYSVDGQPGIKDPVGMSGIRLEVDAHIISLPLSMHKNISKAVFRTGLEINGMVAGLLADSLAVLHSRQKEIGVVLVNIGAATTKVLVMEEGQVVHMAIIPLGAEKITHDIAIVLKTDIDVAERVKRAVGSATPASIDKRQMVNLKDFGATADEEVSVRFIADVIHARVEEIFEKVNAELKKVRREGLLPAGVVLTGGGAELSGIVEAAKEQLRLPAQLGLAQKTVSVGGENVLQPGYTTVIGLLHWGLDIAASEGEQGGFFKKLKGSGGGFGGGVKKFFQRLMPGA